MPRWSARFTPRVPQSAGGLLQAIDPRVKVAGLFALIVAAALASRLWILAAILAVADNSCGAFADFAAHAGNAGVGERVPLQRRDLDSRAVSSRPAWPW